MRRKLVVGNWKMYGRIAQNQALIQAVVDGVRESRNADYVLCAIRPFIFQLPTTSLRLIFNLNFLIEYFYLMTGANSPLL